MQSVPTYINSYIHTYKHIHNAYNTIWENLKDFGLLFKHWTCYNKLHGTRKNKGINAKMLQQLTAVSTEISRLGRSIVKIEKCLKPSPVKNKSITCCYWVGNSSAVPILNELIEKLIIRHLDMKNVFYQEDFRSLTVQEQTFMLQNIFKPELLSNHSNSHLCSLSTIYVANSMALTETPT